MPFDPGAFVLGKLADVLYKLAKEKLQKSEHVVRFLKSLGYELLKDDFETLYVHAVVARRLANTPLPLLKLFKEESVVEAFHLAWQSGQVEPFGERARWAVEVFREGDEVRGLGCDVEQEVRAFYQTFHELVTKARSPGDQRADRLLEAILQRLGQITLPDVAVLPSQAERFRRDLAEWIEACGYIMDQDPDPLQEDGTFDLVASYPRRGRRGFDRFLIRGLDGVGGAGHLHDLPAPKDRGVDASWLVASIDLSGPVRQAAAAHQEHGRLAYTFDDLIDEQVRLEKYQKHLQGEIDRRRLLDYYVPLGCRRPEPDRQGVIRAEDRHNELERYLDWWLAQPIREHVSILGEFGTGKTWFTLRLAHDRLAEYHKAKKSRRPRGRYPLLVQLRDYAKAVSVDSLLSEFFFDHFEVGLPSMKAFRVLNRMGRFLLIFDGFDEMARKVDYQKVVDNFWELAKVVVPGSKAVLTCREEHFRYAREVLAGHEMASTANIVLVPPRFDVIHLEPFDPPRIRRAIVARQGEPAGTRTADLVLSHPALADLVRRPVMIEMVLESLDDIKDRRSLVASQVYLYATDRQMRKNIKEERTFTSMTEKVLFLSELAWEMQRTDTLKLHYKLFPDRIREVFGDRVKETEKDHWHYDLMGQTLLVRDEEGNYSFAHRGLVEYFTAYRLLAQVDALAPEFIDRYRDEPGGPSPAEIIRERAPSDPLPTWGAAPLHPNLVAFLAEMASGKEPVMRLINWTKGKDEDQAGYVGGNAATVLVRIDAAALVRADVAGASLREARLQGARLRGVKAQGVDLRGADLMASDLTKGKFQSAKMQGARVAGLACHCAVACDASGELLFGGPRRGGWVYDLRTRRFLDVYGSPEGDWMCDRAVSADGKWLLHAEGKRLRVGQVDREAGAIEWTFPGAPREFSYPGVAWHPEGWFLVLGQDAGVLRVNPDRTGSLETLELLPFAIAGWCGVVVRPPWWIVGGGEHTTVWHEKERRVLATLPLRATAGERPEVSPAGERVSIANYGGLFIFDTANWERVAHLEGDSEFRTHGWSPTGTRVAFCAGREVLVVYSGDLSIHSRLKPPRTPLGVAFHGPDEIVVVDMDGTILLYDLRTGGLIHSAPQVPLCEGADLRGASGLEEATREALKNAGARVDE